MVDFEGIAGRSERWVRRANRMQRERERIQKHGAGLRRVYLDAVRKRAQESGAGKKA